MKDPGILGSDSGLRRTTGAHVPTDTVLLPSPTGDVWTLSQGAIFLHVCASCHLPGGTADGTIPLSDGDRATIAAWAAATGRMDGGVPDGSVVTDGG